MDEEKISLSEIQLDAFIIFFPSQVLPLIIHELRELKRFSSGYIFTKMTKKASALFSF